MRILERGTSSVQDMVAVVLFNILPQVADIIIACIYIAAHLEVWLRVFVSESCDGISISFNALAHAHSCHESEFAEDAAVKS